MAGTTDCRLSRREYTSRVRCAGVLVVHLGCSDGPAVVTKNPTEPHVFVSGECVAGETRCTIDGLREACEGRHWGAAELCPAGETCDPQLGTACVDRICVPDTIGCDGWTRIIKCNHYGTSRVTVHECVQDQYCEGGECITQCDTADDEHYPLGCRYYAVPLDGQDIDGGATVFEIAVVNPSDSWPADVTIETEDCVTGEWLPAESVGLAPLAGHIFASTDVAPEGSAWRGCAATRVQSSRPVFAYQHNGVNGTMSSGSASLLVAATALLSNESNYAITQSANDLGNSLVTIVGAEDGGSVTIRVTANTVPGPGVDALTAGQTAEYALDEGDVVTLASDTGDLTGTFVSGATPFALFAHHEEGIEEQMLPVLHWGRGFVASPARRTDYVPSDETLWRIFALEDDTTVTFDGVCDGLPANVTLGAGEIYDVQITSACEFYLEADRLVYVMQIVLSREGSAGDPAMITVAEVESWRDEYLLPPALGTMEETASLVRTAGSDVSWDGTSLPGPWSDIDSNGDFQSFQTPAMPGVVSATGDTEGYGFVLSVLGGPDATYGYLAGYSWASIKGPD